jgi:hypothetical protein
MNALVAKKANQSISYLGRGKVRIPSVAELVNHLFLVQAWPWRRQVLMVAQESRSMAESRS